MRTQDFQRLMRILLPSYPSYKIKDSLFFAAPFTHLLRGFYFEPSGFDALAFYVNAFVFPLYVPAEDVNFTFGKRIGGPTGRLWELAEDNIQERERIAGKLLVSIHNEGLPFIESATTPAELVEVATKIASEENPYVQQAIGCSLIMDWKYDEAVKVLNRLYLTLEKASPRVPWQAELMQRAWFLQDLLATNPSEARLTLKQWERETVKNLKLTEFWIGED
jgi:hypothetical protein